LLLLPRESTKETHKTRKGYLEEELNRAKRNWHNRERFEIILQKVNCRKVEERTLSLVLYKESSFKILPSVKNVKKRRGKKRKIGRWKKIQSVSLTCAYFVAHALYLHSSRVCPLFRQLPSPPREIPPRHLFVRALKTACRLITTLFLFFLPLRTTL